MNDQGLAKYLCNYLSGGSPTKGFPDVANIYVSLSIPTIAANMDIISADAGVDSKARS